jgi:hypothetical protein
MDILLERTTFRLADYVIPGHFHHAGVYLGRTDEVDQRLPQAMTVLEQPSTAEGYVIEATHQGVRLVTLNRFLDVDSLAVLRDRSLHPEDRARLYVRAAHDLGKEYDYYFDLDDPRNQFCSKLVATIFSHIDFRLRPKGGLTLVPDHLVHRALVNPALSLTPILLANAAHGVVFDRLEERLARCIGVDSAVTAADEVKSRACAVGDASGGVANKAGTKAAVLGRGICGGQDRRSPRAGQRHRD